MLREWVFPMRGGGGSNWTLGWFHCIALHFLWLAQRSSIHNTRASEMISVIYIKAPLKSLFVVVVIFSKQTKKNSFEKSKSLLHLCSTVAHFLSEIKRKTQGVIKKKIHEATDEMSKRQPSWCVHEHTHRKGT